MSSGRCEFRTAGHLSEHTRGAFADLGDTAVQDAPPETVISGEAVDDAQLHGVLALILNLGLRVVSLHEMPR
ncbi:hypothetical protein [Geodermatophilus normandii]|uniref:Uncharacterized protein n=1 Tax=Geodermatophilus normandii TaxID=1137989 RepID=A0A6P0GHX4_9ACTN|nr:hypothetical protein [Geodermatophilus normandii]NEM06903.1 hypothetical protein [Geodermatophilus normandii]